jgi:hypothetical protein
LVCSGFLDSFEDTGDPAEFEEPDVVTPNGENLSPSSFSNVSAIVIFQPRTTPNALGFG